MAGKKGRATGARNYKKKELMRCVLHVLPNGEYGWEAVALAYQQASNEPTPRNTDDLKKYWINKLCNGMKKPIGRMGADAADLIHKCIAIEKKILEKTHSGMIGLSPTSDRVQGGEDGNETSDDSNYFGSGGGYQSDGSDSDPPPPPPNDAPSDAPVDAAANESMDAVAIESVPSAANQSVDAVAIESVPAQEAGNVSTPRVDMSAVAAAALDKVQSGRGKGQKSKNSSNKNQQRVQIGAAIVDLVQTMRSRQDDGGGSAAAINAMMIRELREMAKDRRKEKRKQRKRRQKRKAKKKARRAAMAELDDHGGKAAGDISSSSSSSSSSSDDSSSDSDNSEGSGYGKGKWRKTNNKT